MEAVQPLHAKQMGRSPQHYYLEGTEDTRKTADIQPLIPGIAITLSPLPTKVI